MEFQDRKAIYLQLADLLCLDILQGKYAADARIPSVREFAASVGVNANTAVRTYDWLQQQDIIYTRRGLGYFVCPGAAGQIAQARKAEFMNERLPELFRTMQTLGISMDEVTEQWNKLQPTSK